MNPSEIGFLALGIALGVTTGAAFLTVVRPRSPLRPVVRVTVTPNAITPRTPGWPASARPRRSPDPVPGSPEEDALLGMTDGAAPSPLPVESSAASRLPETRTRVPSLPSALSVHAVGIPIVGAGQPAPGPGAAAAPAATAGAVAVAERPGAGAEAEIAREPGAELAATVDVGPSRPELAVRPRLPVADPLPSLSAVPTGFVVVASAGPPAAGPLAAGSSKASGGHGPAASSATPSATAADSCADERAAAAVQCRTADAAREAARSAADRLREVQRANAALEAAVEEARAQADPRRLVAEKERLHASFAATHGTTRNPDEAEAAARDWLQAVSAANAAARDAALRVQRGTEGLNAQSTELERLDLEASAARITAERAEDACRGAREALAACEERERSVPAAPSGEPGLDSHWPGSSEPAFDRGPEEPGGDDRLPLVVRVLRGDHAARERLVAELAAGDAAATSAWHVRIARFVDAVTARAIEDGYLDLPEEHAFWRLFSADEQREIVEALWSLGFRFDGFGGFADERVPSARDLSLAVGYAGLDRMRIRVWPGEAALAALFDGAVVRADVWLAAQSDDLTLARVEAALGTRAEAMGDLWDAWGRVRPAMLAAS